MAMTRVRIATQNIQWGGDPAPGGDGQPRLVRLLPYLVALDADVLVLTEYKSGARGAELQRSLRNAGYEHFFHQSPPTRYSLGTAIASRIPVEPTQAPLPAVMDPWRCTAVRLGDIDIFGFYFPLEGMPAYWDWVLANARVCLPRKTILMGDFNTGKHFIDEEQNVFLCAEKHLALEKIGFRDTWRAVNASDRGATWFSSAKRGFRLDYIWASPLIAAQVENVLHNHDARIAGMTDHSAVLADIRWV